MPIRRPLAVACAALALSMPVAPANAQDARDLVAVPRGRTSPEPVAAVTLLDVDFAGGTLAEFVDAVRAAAEPKPVNVVLLAQAGSLSIPPVTLRRVTAESAFRAVCSRSMARVDSLASGGDPIITVETDPGAIVRQSLDQRVSTGRGAGREGEPATLRVYSVRDFVDGQTVTYATVLDALKTTLAADDAAANAEVLHHDASGVLIVRGTNAQQVVVEQVLMAIRKDAQIADGNASRMEGQTMVLRERQADADLQLRRAEVELQAAAEKFAHTRTLAEGSFVSEQEVLEAKRAFELAQLTMEHSAAKKLALDDQWRALQGRLPEGAAGAPVSKRSVQFRTSRPEIAAKLMHVMNEFLAKTGANGKIVVPEIGSATANSKGTVQVEFTGPAEALSHFQAMCNLVEELDRAGD